MTSPLSLDHTDAMRASRDAIGPHDDAFFDRCRERVIERAPALRPLFDDQPDVARSELLAMLALVCDRATSLLSIYGLLRDLGARLARHGVRAEHLLLVRDLWLSHGATYGGDAWTDQAQDAWTETLNATIGLMLEGAERSNAA